MSRTIAEPPLINPVQRFSSELLSWRDPTYLAPLGHSIDPSGPSGVVSAPATPHAELPTTSQAMPLATPAPEPRRNGVFTSLQRVFGGGSDSTPTRSTFPAFTSTDSVSTPAQSVAAPTIGEAPSLESPAALEAPVTEPATRTSHTDLVLAAPVQRSTPLTTSTYQGPTRVLTPLAASVPVVSRAIADPAAEVSEAPSFESPEAAPTLGLDAPVADTSATDPEPTAGPTELMPALPIVPAVQRAHDTDAPKPAQRRVALGAPIGGTAIQRFADTAPPAFPAAKPSDPSPAVATPVVQTSSAELPMAQAPTAQRSTDDSSSPEFSFADSANQSSAAEAPTVQPTLGQQATTLQRSSLETSSEPGTPTTGASPPLAQPLVQPVQRAETGRRLGLGAPLNAPTGDYAAPISFSPTTGNSTLDGPPPALSVSRAAADLPVVSPDTPVQRAEADTGPDESFAHPPEVASAAALDVAPTLNSSQLSAPAPTHDSGSSLSAPMPVQRVPASSGPDPVVSRSAVGSAGPTAAGATVAGPTVAASTGPTVSYGRSPASGPDPLAGLPSLPVVQLSAADGPGPSAAAASTIGAGTFSPAANETSRSHEFGVESLPVVQLVGNSSPIPVLPPAAERAGAGATGPTAVPATNSWDATPPPVVVSRATADTAGPRTSFGSVNGNATNGSAINASAQSTVQRAANLELPVVPPAPAPAPPLGAFSFGAPSAQPANTSNASTPANGTSVQRAAFLPGMLPTELPVAQRAAAEQPATSQPSFVSRTTNQPLVLPPTQEELTAQAVQRMTAGPSEQPSVQTYTTETMSVQAADAAAPTPAGGAPAAAPHAGGAGAAQSPEELLKTLFDPLLRRLKAELRLDRERRGLITDYKR
jgi:hypothetical protein